MDNVIVAAHWEIGYLTPLLESNLWSMLLRDFEVSKWYMTPITGIAHKEARRINLTERASYQDILKEVPEEYQRIYLEPRTKHQNPETVWLHEFEHPAKCIYIFGSAHYNPTIANHRDGDTVVSIKTVQDRGVPWSNQCLFVVLYDRLMKERYGTNDSR